LKGLSAYKNALQRIRIPTVKKGKMHKKCNESNSILEKMELSTTDPVNGKFYTK
jgi:hypothetical protein